ncbi:MAG TPA: MFS transporter [Candidatus Jorgensenbacteria bacterium]|nr:MFS transporter [Candidatus Jorgensenbacteria bacterium]
MKKNITYWALYDFANSLVLMAFLFYFSQWLVIDQGHPVWWYNSALIVSSALFILTAPILSKRIDMTGRKIAGLRMWTVLSFIAFILVSLIATLSDSLDMFATILYTLAMYAYLVCFLYFTPMLNDLSTRENRSYISGIGQGANSFGQVIGLIVTLPFAIGVITLFGDPGRAQALLPATLLFGLFSLPMFFLYKEKLSTDTASLENTSTSLFALFKKVFSYKPLAFLLLAYFLFSDAMLTFANNFPLYLETIHGVSDTVKSVLTMSILGLAAIGAVIFGKIASKKGELKTLKGILIGCCIIFPTVAFIPSFNLLVPVFLLAGILFGPIWAISRSLVGQLAPKGSVASSYSYYVVAERFATFIGPAIWSIALIVMGEGARGYQTAFLAMTGILILSLFALNRIKVER